ncbi:MAG: transketolase [Actinobacteria bacterium]|nr:transketolase [Actinomycetota bacterium]
MDDKIIELKKTAERIRLNTFKAIADAGGGHFGGSLSIVEILTVLYFEIMNIDPKKPDDKNRDRFVLSKGHAGPALYTTLATRGYFPLVELKDLDKPLSKFPKHVDRLKLQGIDVSSGALGMGLSTACGMAISARQAKQDIYVYIIMGDGEINSGQIWEAAMTAAKYKLANIIAILDRNNCQIDGFSDDIMPMEPLADKWSSFGWNVIKAKGHNIASLLNAIKSAKDNKERPNIIIADTIKGYGVSLMEGKWQWHSGKLTEEECNNCMMELEARL